MCSLRPTQLAVPSFPLRPLRLLLYTVLVSAVVPQTPWHPLGDTRWFGATTVVAHLTCYLFFLLFNCMPRKKKRKRKKE